MRRYVTTFVAVCFLLFMVAAMAQSSGSSQSGQYGTPSTSSGSSQSGQHGSQSGQYGSQSSDTTSSQSQASPSAGHSAAGQQTVEGCILREQTDYFLVPRSGNPIRLSSTGTEDLGAHVGHKVKVKGSGTMASSTGAGMGAGAGMGTGMGTSAGASGTAASPSGSQSGKTDNTGAIGSQAGAAGTTGAAGASGAAGTTAESGTGNDLHKLSDRDMTVDRVTMVASSCPMNWNPSVHTPSGTSDTSNPSNR